MMNEKTLAVLIVDDSALVRNIVSKFFDDTPDIEVMDKAMDGVFAFKKIERRQPDVIVLDLEMPRMNGIEFLKERRKRGIDIPVVILSAIAKKGARITMQALELGAADFIFKPAGGTQDLRSTQSQLIEMVRAYGAKYRLKKGQILHPTLEYFRTDTRAAIKKTIQSTEHPAPSRTPILEVEEHYEKRTPKRKPGKIELIAIGISTGGPNALREVLPKLHPALAAPVVVVQHMPAGFTFEFAASLNTVSSLEVKEAEDGDVLKSGRVLVAPGDLHMSVSARALANTVNVYQAPAVNGHRPSCDVLFKSVAEVYQNRCLAVIMTGMGKDGVMEIGRIYEYGGMTLAQDRDSCIVYGMPKAALDRGYIHRVVPLNDLADTINSLTGAEYYS